MNTMNFTPVSNFKSKRSLIYIYIHKTERKSHLVLKLKKKNCLLNTRFLQYPFCQLFSHVIHSKKHLLSGVAFVGSPPPQAPLLLFKEIKLNDVIYAIKSITPMLKRSITFDELRRMFSEFLLSTFFSI